MRIVVKGARICHLETFAVSVVMVQLKRFRIDFLRLIEICVLSDDQRELSFVSRVTWSVSDLSRSHRSLLSNELYSKVLRKSVSITGWSLCCRCRRAICSWDIQLILENKVCGDAWDLESCSATFNDWLVFDGIVNFFDDLINLAATWLARISQSQCSLSCVSILVSLVSFLSELLCIRVEFPDVSNRDFIDSYIRLDSFQDSVIRITHVLCTAIGVRA
jgi:hypothetical protein